MELKGKQKKGKGQSSVNGLLNNSSSVNPLRLPDIMEVDSQRKNVTMKQPIKMVIVMVMHYFHSVLEHGLPPSLNLNNNTYSTLPRTHVKRESMARGTKEHFKFARA